MIERPIRQGQQELSPAMEMTTAELVDIIGGRKELFNQFYDQVVAGMRARGNQLLRAISKYRDKNIETLSSPYLLNYTIFGVEDRQIIWKVTGIDEDEVDKAIKEMKKYIRENCKLRGYQAPASLFENVTGFRVVLLLIMRYYLERGQKEELEECCSYMGYSMFYTLFINSFRHGIRKETMIYTMNTMSNKHKLKHQKDVDGLLTYGISLCAQTYKQRIMIAPTMILSISLDSSNPESVAISSRLPRSIMRMIRRRKRSSSAMPCSPIMRKALLNLWSAILRQAS